MTLVRKSLLLLVLMPAACGSAIALWPTARIADERSPIDLIALIPKRFADCHEDPPQCAAVVNPQQEGVLDKIYKQTHDQNGLHSSPASPARTAPTSPNSC
jgi:hypothetical protein